MRCLAPSSPQFSLWKWSRKWRSASSGITRDLEVSTPAELQKMEAAAIASNTFFLSLRVLKSVRSTELFLVREPAKKGDANPLRCKVALSYTLFDESGTVTMGRYQNSRTF